MNTFGFGGVVLTLVGAGYWYLQTPGAQPDVYPFSVAETRQKLVDVVIPPSNHEAFAMHESEVSSPDANTVTWTMLGSMCVAKLEAVEPKLTRVTHSCGNEGEGVTGNAMGDMRYATLREHIDSTLDGRPYNIKAVATASGVAMLKNMPQMQRDALKMSAEDARSRAEMRAAAADVADTSAATDYSSDE